jgi:hypothetical protein
VVGVAGSQGTHTVARAWSAWLLHLSGRKVGLACRDGLFLDTPPHRIRATAPVGSRRTAC